MTRDFHERLLTAAAKRTGTKLSPTEVAELVGDMSALASIANATVASPITLHVPPLAVEKWVPHLLGLNEIGSNVRVARFSNFFAMSDDSVNFNDSDSSLIDLLDKHCGRLTGEPLPHLELHVDLSWLVTPASPISSER